MYPEQDSFPETTNLETMRMDPINGHCLCGNVGWQIHAPLRAISHCHCQMCRKAHGSAYATYASISDSALEWLKGRDQVTMYPSSTYLKRTFCSQCGSVTPLLCADAKIAIAIGCMDTIADAKPQCHIFTEHKAPWHQITDSLPRFDEYDDDNAVVDRPPMTASTPGVVRGSCLCGKIHYRLSEPFRAVYNCHCSRCRRARAAAYATNGFVPASGLRFVCGESDLVAYKLPQAMHFTQVFCRHCGSAMPRINHDRGIAVVPFGSLDDDPERQADCHIFVHSRADWDVITDDRPQYDQGPPR